MLINVQQNRAPTSGTVNINSSWTLSKGSSGAKRMLLHSAQMVTTFKTLINGHCETRELVIQNGPRMEYKHGRVQQ